MYLNCSTTIYINKYVNANYNMCIGVSLLQSGSKRVKNVIEMKFMSSEFNKRLGIWLQKQATF